MIKVTVDPRIFNRIHAIMRGWFRLQYHEHCPMCNNHVEKRYVCRVCDNGNTNYHDLWDNYMKELKLEDSL